MVGFFISHTGSVALLFTIKSYGEFKIEFRANMYRGIGKLFYLPKGGMCGWHFNVLLHSSWKEVLTVTQIFAVCPNGPELEAQLGLRRNINEISYWCFQMFYDSFIFGILRCSKLGFLHRNVLASMTDDSQ